MMETFTQLPDRWSLERLDRLADVSARIGWRALTAAEYLDEGYAFLATPNIKTPEIDFQHVNYISQFRYDESPELKLQIGDVLLAKDGSTLGITNLVRELPKPATVNGSIAVIRTRRMEPRYLRYVLASSTIQNLIQLKRDGMGVPHLFQRDIRQLPIPVPPHEEQHRIADFLDDQITLLDRAVALRQRQISLVTEATASHMEHLVTQGLDNSVALALAAFEPLGTVPAHWGQGRLRSVRCEVQTGPFGSQLHAAEYVQDGWPVVNPANLKAQGIVPDRSVTVDEKTRAGLARHILQPGDVVFGRRGELGRAAVVTDGESGWVCGTGCLRVRFAGAAFDAGYLARYLRLAAVRYYF